MSKVAISKVIISSATVSRYKTLFNLFAQSTIDEEEKKFYNNDTRTYRHSRCITASGSSSTVRALDFDFNC
jgi:hypothetical protein